MRLNPIRPPHVFALLTIVATIAGFAGPIHSAGFALIEQSVPDMGTAYAGAAASARSVDALWFNPAGITRLPGTRGAAAVHLVLPQTRFKDQGSTFVTGAPLGGGNGGDAGGLAAVPHAYLSHQLNEHTWAGLAVNLPFGLTTHYDDAWVGRYHAIKSAVSAININPSIALRASDALSLGFGLNAMYLEGEFTNAVDFGLLTGGPAAAGTLDGKSRIRADSWGYGFNIGALLEVSEHTRVGLHYRSNVAHELEGDTHFTLPSPTLAGVFSDTVVTSDVDLPATLSLSGFHQLNDEWALMADYTWTRWSSIPELRFRFANGLPDGVSTYDWIDTSRISAGTAYQPKGSRWTYRLGVAYDESPIQDDALRTPRLPDGDRTWLTLGGGIEIDKNLSLDVGYAHIFIDDPVIAKAAVGEDLARGALYGTYDSQVDILSVEARYRF